jgi:hypothetical protein
VGARPTLSAWDFLANPHASYKTILQIVPRNAFRLAGAALEGALSQVRGCGAPLPESPVAHLE